MCGVAGLITKDKNIPSFNHQKKKMKKLMFSRGPNQQGSFNEMLSNLEIRLFSSRLSIIDTEDRSNQPYYFENLILIFNGEIYNYKEIRIMLQKKGYSFFTNSDTEVLIKSYHFWGEDCVKFFDGMWAFAIYDRRKKELFLSRDNFGEKPLYYYYSNKNFIFGSEIKYLQNLTDDKNILSISQKKINSYLFQGYKSLIKDDVSFFKNIYSIEPGCNFNFKLKNFNFKKTNYFKREQLLNSKIPKDVNENIYDVKKLINESLRLRLRSDVPVAFCLSGGIDSASLVSLASKKFGLKPKCFSIIDKDLRYNEEKNINIIAKDTESDIQYINLKKEKKSYFLDNLKNLVNYHDSPISTISYYIHSKISKEASNLGYKVILSGTGADEIFTGYYDHFLLFLNEIKKKNKFKTELDFWKKFIYPNTRNENLKKFDLFIKNPNFRDHIYFDNLFIKNFSKKKLDVVFKEKKYSKNILKNRMLNELFHESVPVILKEDDLNSMYNSIENRSPFLSKKLVKYALSINNAFYIKNGYSKFILRQALKGVLNSKVRLDRRKIGFNSNINNIVNLDKKFLKSFLNENYYLKQIINLDNIKYFDFDKELSNSDSKFIFSLINIKIFLDNYSL